MQGFVDVRQHMQAEKSWHYVFINIDIQIESLMSYLVGPMCSGSLSSAIM